jgi:hypothetical protein
MMCKDADCRKDRGSMRIGAEDIRRLIADNSLVVKAIIGTDGD